MVVIEEGRKLIEPASEPRRIKTEGSLLEKYGIPIQHLDFDYVEKCSDGKELERILQILQSGEEGYYPELSKATELRLSAIKPKSKYLRKMCPVLEKGTLPKSEQKELDDDLKEWVATVNEYDTQLGLYKGKHRTDTNLPIREPNEKIDNGTTDTKTNLKRISATDYSSWDKYDADTELLKMDLQEEKTKTVAKEKSKKATKKVVQFKEFDNEIEALHEALYEKDKGNEFYRAGDYKEAHHHYTASINIKPTPQCLANRALINLKLKKYEEALQDSNAAAAMEPNNGKAHVRKAQALEGLNRNDRALESAERAIELEPNNVFAQSLAAKFRNLCGISMKNRRLIIEEVSQSSPPKHKSRKSKEKSSVIISIPGPSNMGPPHYVVCPNNNPKRIQEETLRINSITQAGHINIELPQGQDVDDSCTINHLERICTVRREGKHTKSIYQSDNNSVRIEEIAQSKETVKIRKTVAQKDKFASGEPHSGPDELEETPGEVNSPYSFLKAWQNANNDATLHNFASILQNVATSRIVEVIGLKLDNAMFTTMLRCLTTHFAVPGQVDKLHSILENVIRLPRFDIITMLLSSEDRRNVRTLIEFLKQHGRLLSDNALKKLCDSQ